jgi:hypothetical protein
MMPCLRWWTPAPLRAPELRTPSVSNRETSPMWESRMRIANLANVFLDECLRVEDDGGFKILGGNFADEQRKAPVPDFLR